MRNNFSRVDFFFHFDTFIAIKNKIKQQLKLKNTNQRYIKRNNINSRFLYKQ